MSYESVVLADNPVFYARLDDVTGTTVMTDLSASGSNGTFYPGAGFGLFSPIETDASSRAIGGHVGYVRVEDESLSNFTWEAWGLHDSAGNGGSLITRGGQLGLGSSNFLAINTNNAHARITISGSGMFDLVYALPSSNAWYHLVAVRNGTTLRLYVNGVLRAEKTGADGVGTGDIAGFGIADPSTNPNGYTYIGTGQTADVFASPGTDEPAIYATALSAGRVLAHYEAAKAVLPLRATITINLSVELNTDQIQPVSFGHPHNYAKTFGDGQVPIIEELEFRTNINKSEPDYEQRVNARPHGPLRTIEYHISPTSGAARARFQGELYVPGQFYTLPIWSDAGVTTSQANSGTNVIPCDTTKRDYQALSYCGVCTDPQNPASYQFFQIASGGVADAQLTLASNIGTTIPSGSLVFPARVASISEDMLSVHSFASDHEDSVIKFDIIESELSIRRVTAYTPSVTYLSHEVFTLETAKVPFLDDRPYSMARRIQQRERDYFYARDTGSPQTFPIRFLLTSRSALSEFLGWLDARQGKAVPFWVSSKEKDLIPSAGTGSTITVAKTGFSLHHGRRHLEFLRTDGVTERARVTSIVDNLNGTETWTVPSPAFGSIAKVSFLKFCTLAQDTITLRHFKGGANGAILTECGLNVRELLTSPSS